MNTASQHFYKNLSAVPLHVGLCDIAYHHDVPDDWCVVIGDIIGSTKAVAEGRYKDVNIASACSITAVLNKVGHGDICYIYGGDGATFIIPASAKFDVAAALYGTREMTRDSFDLDMRAGMVDVRELRAAGAQIRVAKLETAPGVYQASLSGDGISLAEKWVKDKDLKEKYHIDHLFDAKAMQASPASFAGFECRWEPIQSRNGIDLSLIVQARGKTEAESGEIYRDILLRINDICGLGHEWKPVSTAQLTVTGNPKTVRGEATVRTHGQGTVAYLKYWLNVVILTIVGAYCFRFGKKAGSFDGATYREATVKNTDFLKFDNALRLIMDIKINSCEKLEGYLNDLYRQDKIFYGTHAAASALMTCLVFDYNDNHFHFIDGADGGYSLAAKMMKAQIKLAV